MYVILWIFLQLGKKEKETTDFLGEENILKVSKKDFKGFFEVFFVKNKKKKKIENLTFIQFFRKSLIKYPTLKVCNFVLTVEYIKIKSLRLSSLLHSTIAREKKSEKLVAKKVTCQTTCNKMMETPGRWLIEYENENSEHSFYGIDIHGRKA